MITLLRKWCSLLKQAKSSFRQARFKVDFLPEYPNNNIQIPNHNIQILNKFQIQFPDSNSPSERKFFPARSVKEGGRANLKTKSEFESPLLNSKSKISI